MKIKNLFKFGMLASAILCTSFLYFANGCYYDSEEFLYPNLQCDTLSLSFSKDVFPIISNDCNSCHSTAGSGGGIVLLTYAEVKAQVTNGKLVGSIIHAGGFSPMPKNSTKLSDCKINKIKAWISQGSLNN